jgi:hypothetical protein
MRSRHRSALVAAACLLIVGGSVAMAPTSSAHTCAYAKVVVNGDTVKSVGSCDSVPPPSDHLCVEADVPPAGTTYVYSIVCADL